MCSVELTPAPQWAQVHLFRLRLKFQYIIETCFFIRCIISRQGTLYRIENIFFIPEILLSKVRKKAFKMYVCNNSCFVKIDSHFMLENALFERKIIPMMFFLVIITQKMMENSFKISVWEIVVHFGTFLTFLYGNNVWLTSFFCKGYGWLFFRNADFLKNPLLGSKQKYIYTYIKIRQLSLLLICVLTQNAVFV